MSNHHTFDTQFLTHFKKETLAHLPKEKHLKAFSELYLEAIDPRFFKLESPKRMADFLTDRFHYFKEAIKSKNYFRILMPKTDPPQLTDKHVLEYICPNAPFLLLTVEALFRAKGLRITRMLHPIMTVYTSTKGQIEGIQKAKIHTNLYSITYLEFEDVEDESILDQLQEEITIHISAVQSHYRDHNNMLSLLSKIKKNVKKSKAQTAEPLEEWAALFDWLVQTNFSFFGYTTFRHETTNKPHTIKESQKNGLGILSSPHLKIDNSHLKETLKAHTWRLRNYTEHLVFDTIKVLSPIQRFENLMRLSIKLPDKKGTVEHVFLGLLRRSSLQAKNMETPLIHLKMQSIFKIKNMLPDSYDYNEVIRIFTDIPKFELFRTPADHLLQMVKDLLSVTNPNELYCFNLPRQEGTKLPLLIMIPPTLFTKHNISAIIAYLKDYIPHSDLEAIRIYSEEYCRLHLYFDEPIKEEWEPDCDKIEKDIREIVKPWQDKLKDAIQEDYPGILGKNLFSHYAEAFPSHYRVRRTPKETVSDILYLEKLTHENTLQFSLVPFYFSGSVYSGKTSLLTLYNRKKIDLIEIMPILQNLGIHIFDELTTRIGSKDNLIGYILTFRICDAELNKIEEKEYSTLIIDVLNHVFKNQTENDPLNGLTLKAKLNWRQINIVQTYRNLYLQLGAPYSKEKVTQTLLSHPHSTQLIVDYFETKFSTASSFGKVEYRNEILLPAVKQKFIDSLQTVDEVSDDIILRRLLNLVQHSLRTNFYIPKPPSKNHISIKLDSQNVRQMPQPAPKYEIYVHAYAMEGTHLRFGNIARGGLRWSDRPHDFRKEILGLAKTQEIKNVVIVPVGAKGGFIIKQKGSKKEVSPTEAQTHYRTLIEGLLDITDTLDTQGQIKHPNHIVAYDGPDPYLVVAADKGTAFYSDIANEISEKYHFWLGDAFASGGSAGYNHKDIGITAKGAWECIKLHFLEMGHDIQTQPITVAGIGDMSGDVFGNGMLLSKKIKLVAAFNHQHIFIDPIPNPEASWQERHRLFKLPKSNWRDYSTDLISPGGGVFNRKAKEIHLSPQMKASLDITQDTMTGEEVVNAILKMTIDLLWFGGIGTYIKSSQETNLEVGDAANDAARINSHECRAAVIGEGANLGMTQLARIEFDTRGGRINTDAIDNAAGVNMSDYEVNLKILLNLLLKEGFIADIKTRTKRLMDAVDDVTELVLKNNQGQHQLLSMDTLRSKRDLNPFVKTIHYFLSNKLINAIKENIPNPTTLDELRAKNAPMPRPVLALLQAHEKMRLFSNLMRSDIAEDPYLDIHFENYFPIKIRKKFKLHLGKHPLKKHITNTLLTNKIINQAGISFFYHIETLTGKEPHDIARAYLIIEAALEGDSIRKEIAASLAGKSDQYQALLSLEDLIQSLTINLLNLPEFTLSFKLINTLYPVVKDIKYHKNTAQKKDNALRKFYRRKKFGEALCQELSSLSKLTILTDIFYLTSKEKLVTNKALRLVIDSDRLFEFEWLAQQVQKADVNTIWEIEHKDILLQSLRTQKLHLLSFLIHHYKKVPKEKINYRTLHRTIESQFGGNFKLFKDSLGHLKSTLISLTLQDLYRFVSYN